MQTILSELLDHYNRFVPEAEFLQEIENAHQQLRRSLEKPERRLVLRIIDNKDLISDARARESVVWNFIGIVDFPNQPQSKTTTKEKTV